MLFAWLAGSAVVIVALWELVCWALGMDPGLGAGRWQLSSQARGPTVRDVLLQTEMYRDQTDRWKAAPDPTAVLNRWLTEQAMGTLEPRYEIHVQEQPVPVMVRPSAYDQLKARYIRTGDPEVLEHMLAHVTLDGW